MSLGGRMGSSSLAGLPEWASMWGAMAAASLCSRFACASGGGGKVWLLFRYSCCNVCSRACMGEEALSTSLPLEVSHQLHAACREHLPGNLPKNAIPNALNSLVWTAL